jgi:Protein of unknown function (DUF1552)
VSYRVRRRAFLASLAGAAGFSSLLSKLEAAAEGAGAPPRFLLMFWPCGTVPYRFLPQGSGRTYVSSPILRPFETSGLREDMIVLSGLRDDLLAGGSGGSEGGVVMRTTCADIPGTRENGGERDDAVAGGPSIDQLLLRRVPELVTAHTAPVNAICDARVDSNEISARCLSYAYETRSVPSTKAGETLVENVPLMPELSPAKLYASLFSSFMPGGAEKPAQLTNALKLKKSVLDYSLGELRRLNGVAPASEREKIEAHSEAIRKLERQLSQALAEPSGRCELPLAPDPSLVGKSGNASDYGAPDAPEGEEALLAELGRLHLGVIRAAFQCDVTRVATFQWMPSTNHVAFRGMYPGDLEGAYRHHPLSHRVLTSKLDEEPPPGATHDVLEFLANVQTWLNARTAEALLSLKTTRDIFGAPLLDHTIAPFVTDTADVSHARSPLPALLFGGRALGLQGGQLVDYQPNRPFADVWLTVFQAYLRGADVKTVLADEVFMRQHGDLYDVLPGLWEPP